MNKNTLKFWNDVLMLIDFLALAISGFVLKFILPRGSGKIGSSFIFLRETWLGMHDWSAIIIVILLLIHLVLNFAWIKSMFKSLFKVQN